MTTVELAPIKLNLFLHIVGRRADGYHLLQSLFVFADIGDTIQYSASDAPLSLDIIGPFAGKLSANSDNLVLRAAHLLKAQPTGKLILDKQVPVASGLGGGSADAAATLRLLNRVWQLGHSPQALRQLGAQLGADVPACIDSVATYVGGIGNELSAAGQGQELAIVVANPGVATATPAVFGAYRALGGDFHVPLADWPRPHQSWRDCDNDLAAPAQAITSEIKHVIQSLEAIPQAYLARMSGSGASCFAVFPSHASAAAAAKKLAADHPSWWVQSARIKAPKA